MMTTTQFSLDAALALGKRLYALVFRLDLAAVGVGRGRLRSAMESLAIRLADANVCHSRRRVLFLLDGAKQYAHRLQVLLEWLHELKMLGGEDQAIGITARQKLAELRALLDRLLGRKPDLCLVPDEEPASSPSLSSPNVANVAEGTTGLGSGHDDTTRGTSWVDGLLSPREDERSGNEAFVATPARCGRAGDPGEPDVPAPYP